MTARKTKAAPEAVSADDYKDALHEHLARNDVTITELTQACADYSTREGEYRTERADLRADVQHFTDAAATATQEIYRLHKIIAETPTKEQRQASQRFIEA